LTHDPLMHALTAPGMSAITLEAVLARLGELAAPGFGPYRRWHTRESDPARATRAAICPEGAGR
jgi:hypothetical protein